MRVLSLLFVTLLLVTGVSTTALAQNPPTGSSAGAASVAQKRLIPECLRVAEQVRTTGASCVLDSITFYTNLLLFVVAVASLLYMLYGAFLYASAFGDESKVGLAKKTITYAIVGILLAGMSALLVAVVKSILKA